MGLIKLSKVYLHSAIYEKLDPTSINEVSIAKAAIKVLSTNKSFHLHILHSTGPPNEKNMDKKIVDTMTHLLYASYDDEPFNSCPKVLNITL